MLHRTTYQLDRRNHLYQCLEGSNIQRDKALSLQFVDSRDTSSLQDILNMSLKTQLHKWADMFQTNKTSDYHSNSSTQDHIQHIRWQKLNLM